MRPVSVRIMHPGPGPDQGPLERWLAEVRAAVARRHATGFAAAGASDVEIVSAPPDATPFGARLRDIVSSGGGEGLFVLGSGPSRWRRPPTGARSWPPPGPTTGGRWPTIGIRPTSVAIARTATLPAIPDLPGDNALPRWLEEVAGYRVDDLRRRWRLGFDIDGPLDVVLLRPRRRGARRCRARDGTPGGDPGRRARIRAPRCSSPVERRPPRWPGSNGTPPAASARGSRSAGCELPRGWRSARPRHGLESLGAPASVLGIVLDEAGPGALGALLARLCDAAIVDTRVLLAHRLGADETGWPSAEDRFASDLLLSERVVDPWLRALTASAAAAPIPILLGGHTLVGPGMRLVIGQRAHGIRRGRDAGPPPRSRAGPRRRRAGRGARGADPRRDRA